MESYLSLQDILDAIPISRATLYRWVNESRFPRPVRLGPRRSAWLSSEVAQWQAARAAERRPARAD